MTLFVTLVARLRLGGFGNFNYTYSAHKIIMSFCWLLVGVERRVARFSSLQVYINNLDRRVVFFVSQVAMAFVPPWKKIETPRQLIFYFFNERK